MVKKTDTKRSTKRSVTSNVARRITKRKRRKPVPNCPAIQRIREKKLATFVAGQLKGPKRRRVSRSAVSMWRRVPAKHVIAVSKLLRIASHRIRPDLYPAKRS